MKDLEKRPRSREKHMKVPETGMNSGSVKSKELMWLEQWGLGGVWWTMRLEL